MDALDTSENIYRQSAHLAYRDYMRPDFVPKRKKRKITNLKTEGERRNEKKRRERRRKVIDRYKHGPSTDKKKSCNKKNVPKQT